MSNEHEDDLKDEKNPRPLDEDDIALLKTYVCLFLSLKPYVSQFLFYFNSIVDFFSSFFFLEFFWFC